MVLILLNGKCMEKFILTIDDYKDIRYVTTWLDAAVSRNTKVLEFHDTRCRGVIYDSPSSLFTCKTLEVLYLDGDVYINVPNLVFLPNLKTLQLDGVIFHSDESVRKFISGCPLLENLNIQRWRYDNVVTFSIFSRSLRNLTFVCEDRENWIPDHDEIEYKLEIYAPALTCLSLRDDISDHFYVDNLCLLEEAEIGLRFDESVVYPDHYPKAVAKLLEGLHNSKKLSLMDGTLRALRHSGIMTSFRRLSQLTVEGECCYWNSLQNVVEGSNKLEILKFTKIKTCPNGTHGTCWRTPERMPICLLSCLTTISIGKFVGLVDELAMVAYMLKNAKVLKTMTIQVPQLFETGARLQLLRKISVFLRGSDKCEITFN